MDEVVASNVDGSFAEDEVQAVFGMGGMGKGNKKEMGAMGLQEMETESLLSASIQCVATPPRCRRPRTRRALRWLRGRRRGDARRRERWER